MTLTCGQNVFTAAVKGSSGGCATEREALDAALSDLLWNSLIDALIDLRKKTDGECPQLCRKKVYDRPRVRLMKHATVRDPQGTFGCEIELELREWVACTKEIEVAVLDVPALEALKVVEVGPAMVPLATAAVADAPTSHGT